MENVMKTLKSLEEYGLLIKCFSKANEREAKEQRGGFITLLMVT